MHSFPAVIILCCFFGMAQAQTDSQAELRLRVTTRLVVFGLFAYDQHELPVSDLKADELKISDNGIARPVANLSLIEQPAETAVTKNHQNELPARFRFSNRVSADTGHSPVILLLDTLNTRSVDRPWLSRAASSLLHAKDLPGCMSLYVLGHEVQPLRECSVDDQPRDPAEVLARLEFAFRSVDEYSDEEKVSRTADALGWIGKHFSALPGPKRMIWVSSGVPFSVACQTLNGPAPDGVAARLAPQARRALAAVSQRDLTIYPFLKMGLAGNSQFANLPIEFVDKTSPNKLDLTAANPQANALGQFAISSGGEILEGQLLSSVEKLMRRTLFSYQIGFHVDSDEWEKHKHHLRVTTTRKGVHLRYRGNFIPETGKASDMSEPNQLLSHALAGPYEFEGIKLSVEVQVDQSVIQAVITVDVTGVSFQTQNGKQVASLDLLIAKEEGRQLALQ